MVPLKRHLINSPRKGSFSGLTLGCAGMCGGCAGDVRAMCGFFFGRHLINSRKKWIMGCAGMCG